MALIDEMRRQNSRSFGDAAAASLDSRVAQIPTAGLKAPAADGSQNNPLNNDLGRAITNTAAALPGAAGIPGVAAPAAGLVARAFGASQPAASALGSAVQAAAPYAPVVAGGAALAGAANSASPPPSSLPAAQPAPRSLIAAAGLSGAGAAGPAASSAPTQAMLPSSSQVTRVGNSYSGTNISGDVSINGAAPGGGYSAPSQPSRSLVSAAGIAPVGGGASVSGAARGNPLVARALGGSGDRMADQAQAESTGRLMASGQVAAPGPGFSGVIGQQSGTGNTWSRSPEQQRRDAEVQASSIHRPTAAIGASALQAQDAQALEGVRGQNALVQEAMRQSGALGRESVQQQGSNQRSLWQAALEQQRVDQAGEAQGFANRAAAQQEQLRATLTDPNATAAQRQAAQQALLAVSGRQQQGDWRVQVTPTTKNVDGSTSEGSVIRFNQATGQAERVDVGQGGGLPSGMTKQVGTSNGKPVYEDANGRRFVAG